MSNWRKVDFSTVESKDPSGSLEINFENFFYSSTKHRLIGSKYKALRYSEQFSKAEKFINENKTHGFNFNNMIFPSVEKDIFYNQLRILIAKMKAFGYIAERYKLNSKYSLGETLLGTLRGGFKFNSEYKKKIEEDTRSYLRGETDYVYQDFPASHLLPWLDEEPISQIYVFDEPIKIDQQRMDQVINIMDDNIIDDAFIRDIDLIDAYYLLNSKKMNHLDKKGRTKTSYECRGDELDISFPQNDLDYLFKKVTTDPATSRMAGLPTVKTRNVGYAAHTNLDKVTCSKRDLYKEGIIPSVWQNKLSSFDGHFIMIDFKKSGLTTNREVIKAVYRTALKHYEKFRPWVVYLDCLENIYVNGSLSKRGTSLGMDDNALSFFLSCAFENWLYLNSEYIGTVEGYFKGDDQIIICNHDIEETKIIFRKWLKDLRKLGLLVNAKKSFIGKRGQFCEVVGMGKGIDNKIIEFSLNNFDALGTYNMVDFKIFLRNLKKAFDDNLRYSRIFDYCLASTILSVNTEFGTYDEIVAPYEMGGYFSNYERGLNTFIEDVLSFKFKGLDRRLFNVIGIDPPTQSFEYRRAKKVFESIFKDTENIISKLKKISHTPMSKGWRESYDFCLEERRKAFNGKIEIIGSKLQKLIDLRQNYSLPESLLRRNPRMERNYVPSRKFKPALRKKLMGKQMPKNMINKIEKKFYFIDKIRAQELLFSAKDGNNKFGIKYYYQVPASTLVWSCAKYFATSRWAIPMNWAEYCYETGVSLDNLWSYYSAKGINLYDYQPRDKGETNITDMFRGPKNADTITFCPYSGFPIKFSSWEFYVNRENRGKDKRFFLDLSDHYYKEWLDDEHQKGWYGPNDRNRPLTKEKFLRIYKELKPEEVAVTQSYYSEVLQPYLIQEGYITQENEPDIPKAEDWIETEEPQYESEHLSDSDLLEDYFKDNPLNTDTDEENDPYQNLSSDSEPEG